MQAGDAWEASRNESEHSKALVFTNDVGHHLQPKRVYLHFKKIAEEIGDPDARVHDLCHTFAVLSLQNSDDVKTVNRIKKVMCFQRIQAFTNKHE